MIWSGSARDSNNSSVHRFSEAILFGPAYVLAARAIMLENRTSKLTICFDISALSYGLNPSKRPVFRLWPKFSNSHGGEGPVNED